jgi:hypothetical protein
MENKFYKLSVLKNSKVCSLQVQANTTTHASAQAEDICRSLNADSYSLHYELVKETQICTLFKKLAYNLFDFKICEPWLGYFSNNVPCLYVLGQRYYTRILMLKYLDIPQEGVIARPSCNCKSCVSDLAPGTPTIAVGKVSTSEKDDKNYLNYTLDKILYLPKSSKSAPKKAVDPEKGKIAAAAIGSIDFSL